MNIFSFAIVALTLGLASCLEPTDLFDEQSLDALANLDFYKLPTDAQFLIKGSPFRSENVKVASHWCCTNDQPVNAIQRTKVAKAVHNVMTKIKVGYTNCGFNGWMRCSTYANTYKQVVEYHVDTYEVPDESSCPDHHVKCCKNYILVAGNCLELSVVSEHIDLFKELAAAGLLDAVNKQGK